jgi:predicted nucleotidyltransferase component of viral defense system
MIRKQDVLDRAAEWGLRPDVVEKDYALGWLLVAIARHPESAQRWVFKGGTCLKKCFVETYRFSEDLDFSLLPDAVYTAEGLLTVLREIAREATQMSGIDFAEGEASVRARQDKLGRTTFQGKVGYRGPLAVPGVPRILLDLTRHELVAGDSVRRSIFHPYPDTFPRGSAVSTYSLEELLAEKTRALWERTRPRDAYDVVFLLDNDATDVDLNRTRDLFARKCRAKGLEPPESAALAARVRDDAELRSEWENMLAHQLPQLPSVDGVIERIVGGLLGWLDRTVPAAATPPPPVAVRAGEEPLPAPALRFWGNRFGSALESIRFAGANRLLVEFEYSASHRVVEPYSFRRSRAGGILLYAFELAAGHIKAFDLSKISNLRVASKRFQPRHAVELGVGSPVFIPPVAHRPHGLSKPSAWRGVAYVYACAACGRSFLHKKRDSALKRHSDDQGIPCSGRRGYFVETLH